VERRVLTLPHQWRVRAGILAVLTAIALAAIGVVALQRPRQYSAQTTVFIGGVLPATRLDVDASVTDFETVIRLPQVMNVVAKQTGVPTTTLMDRLSFRRVPSSSAVQVSLRLSSAAQASAAVTAAAHQALLEIAQQQSDGAREGVTAAEAAVQRAQNALTAFAHQHGVADLQVEYQARQRDLANLESQIAKAPAGQVPTLESLVALRTQELGTLGAVMPQYQQLSTNLAQATATLHAADATVTQAQSRLDAAGSPSILTSPTITKDSRVDLLARALLATAIAAIVLGIALFVIVDRVAAGRVPFSYGSGGGRPTGPGQGRSGVGGRGAVLAPEP
jgi:hypothetical protein